MHLIRETMRVRLFGMFAEALEVETVTVNSSGTVADIRRRCSTFIRCFARFRFVSPSTDALPWKTHKSAKIRRWPRCHHSQEVESWISSTRIVMRGRKPCRRSGKAGAVATCTGQCSGCWSRRTGLSGFALPRRCRAWAYRGRGSRSGGSEQFAPADSVPGSGSWQEQSGSCGSAASTDQ